ncbi:ribosomal protein L7/L12 [Mycobacterium sp.]|uniref:ribosomal protein L7/L12 n=1 Tax=Mycobacterium sp. TaxID=1785 RepID=UPI002C654BD7|nr:ribosomal protein L7/L12 [Mycobacterium sp.]HTQ22658.1 ribosomal protein L7/L12 [Mycobacterium sp.]
MTEIDDIARARLDHVEAQLQALFPGRYVSYAEATAIGVPPRVIELVRAGNKIAAIQAYRNATGAGLAEAKDVIDSL